MKSAEYDEMISRLKLATEKNMLKWSLDKDDSTLFTTSVNGCIIDVSVYYDSAALSNKAILELYNTDGESFKRKVFSEKGMPERFNQINELHDLIYNNYYKIKESENLILDGLRELTGD